MLREAAWVAGAAVALWAIRFSTGYELLGEHGARDYVMLLAAPLAIGVALTVYCKGRMRWSYGILAVTLYCFTRMIYMGLTGYAEDHADRTIFIFGVTALNWTVMILFALAGGGAGGMYYKLRELSDILKD